MSSTQWFRTASKQFWFFGSLLLIFLPLILFAFYARVLHFVFPIFRVGFKNVRSSLEQFLDPALARSKIVRCKNYPCLFPNLSLSHANSFCQFFLQPLAKFILHFGVNCFTASWTLFKLVRLCPFLYLVDFNIEDISRTFGTVKPTLGQEMLT